MRKKGFTLIELLVVISIIALLLAILMPSLALVKEKAKLVICKTNLKQYGLAIKMYLLDNGDDFPYARASIFDPLTTGQTYSCQWHDGSHNYMGDKQKQGPLFEYMESMKIHLCPTFKKFAREYGPNHLGHNNSGIAIEPVYSYSQNVFLGHNPGVWEKGVKKGSQVVRPAKVITFVEETLWQIDGFASHILNDTIFFARHMNDSFEGDCIATYHGTSVQKKNDGEGNTIFFDGHVDLLDYKEKFEYSWGTLSASFTYSWPKGRVGSQRPY
ncbi:MAG: type II secretion system protein [Anaerohalosphaera sp.]|nr:type II secretion system protein [Anaerohalosphaera sp.]